jgi:hypothetical protein
MLHAEDYSLAHLIVGKLRDIQWDPGITGYNRAFNTKSFGQFHVFGPHIGDWVSYTTAPYSKRPAADSRSASRDDRNRWLLRAKDFIDAHYAA